MEANHLKILAIDDNRDNLTSLRAVLRDALPGVEVVTSLNGFEGARLAQVEDPDVILLDVVMPEVDGYMVCQHLKDDAFLRDIPVLFMTALGSSATSRSKALAVGAEGFIGKPFDEIDLVAQIRAMVKIKAASRYQRAERERLTLLVEERTAELEEELAERKAIELSLRQFESIFEQSTLGAAIADTNGIVTHVNRRWAQDHGYEPEELIGQSLSCLHDEEQMVHVHGLLRQMTDEGSHPPQEVGHLRRDGTRLTMLMTGTLIRNDDGTPGYFAATALDLTERKELEEQFRQAQKMEAVGRLAGGVAHDFNNVLTVILGQAQLGLMHIPPSDPMCATLQAIEKAGKHAARLTQQLLAFARKQTVNPEVLDLNHCVDGALNMLGRIMGEDIQLSWQAGDGLWPVKVDPTQIDQIVANLCVNARDAIAGAGTVALETSNLTLSEVNPGHPEVPPGDYVVLAVSDTGCGMDKATLANIFEPFFTTKSTDQGTGLGLSTVYGIVRQNDGFINVHSELGRGTTFRIYLPRCEEAVAKAAKEGTMEIPRGRGETILLVEDEPEIVKLARTMLEELGYRVLTAGTAHEAICLAANHADDISLLITDVVMPGANGRHLSEHLRTLRSGLKTLFMSGYTADVIADRGVLDEGVNFLQKPFSLADLGAKVTAVLAGN